MGFPAGHAPNLRDLQITTIYLVHVTVGQQFGLNSPQQLFFWSRVGSFMCLLLSAITPLISWVGTSWFTITLLTHTSGRWLAVSQSDGEQQAACISSPSRLVHTVAQ